MKTVCLIRYVSKILLSLIDAIFVKVHYTKNWKSKNSDFVLFLRKSSKSAGTLALFAPELSFNNSAMFFTTIAKTSSI